MSNQTASEIAAAAADKRRKDQILRGIGDASVLPGSQTLSRESKDYEQFGGSSSSLNPSSSSKNEFEEHDSSEPISSTPGDRILVGAGLLSVGVVAAGVATVQ